MMRQVYLWMILVMFSVSCKKAEEFIDASTKLSDVLVSKDRWIKDLKFDIKAGFKVHSIKLRYSPSEKKTWIIRKAKSRIGNCITERYPLVKVDGKHYMKLSGYAERCTGIGCTDCAFTGHGCECEDIEPWRKCKYSKIKIANVLRLKDE